MSLIRVLRTAAATLTRTTYVDETPTDAAAPLTVSVNRLDGTLVTSGTSTHPGPTGQYTFLLPGGPASPASASWQFDHLDVTWSGTVGGAATTLADRVEVVGGYLFGLAEARASDPTLTSTTTYPTATMADKRIEVEEECEKICRQAFVPRYWRETLSGRDSDRLGLKHMMLRRVRSVTISGVAWTGTASTIPPSEHGILRNPTGVWPAGAGNIVVEYEHGWDRPPERVSAAAMLHLRYLLNQTRAGTSDRVTAYTTEAGSFHAAQRDESHTGYPDVDGVYARYTRTRRAATG